MKWTDYIEKFVSGEITGPEMVDFLSRHILDNPSDEEEIMRSVLQHDDEHVSGRAGELQEWLRMSRDAGGGQSTESD
jgi:hypothetical protein